MFTPLQIVPAFLSSVYLSLSNYSPDMSTDSNSVFKLVMTADANTVYTQVRANFLRDKFRASACIRISLFDGWGDNYYKYYCFPRGLNLFLN